MYSDIACLRNTCDKFKLAQGSRRYYACLRLRTYGFGTTPKLATDDSQDVCEMRKTSETRGKKGMHEITDIRDSIIFSYNYFIPHRTRKSICLLYNYRFYHETVRDAKCKTREICLVKQLKKYEITGTHVSHLTCFLISWMSHELSVTCLSRVISEIVDEKTLVTMGLLYIKFKKLRKILH